MSIHGNSQKKRLISLEYHWAASCLCLYSQFCMNIYYGGKIIFLVDLNHLFDEWLNTER